METVMTWCLIACGLVGFGFVLVLMLRIPDDWRKEDRVKRGIMLLMKERESFTLSDVVSTVKLSADAIVEHGGGGYLWDLVNKGLLTVKHQPPPETVIYEVTEKGKQFVDNRLKAVLCG